VQGEDLDAVGTAGAIFAAAVNGERGLAVGGGGDQAVDAGGGQHEAAEEPADLVPPAEPGGDRRHLKGGVLVQQLDKRGDVGVLDGSRIPVENRAVRLTRRFADLVGSGNHLL
jgi:hypothetical protein